MYFFTVEVKKKLKTLGWLISQVPSSSNLLLIKDLEED